MRAQDWKGLVTDASPYALPPGAATEQVNLRSNTSGQLTCRGGMRVVAFGNQVGEEVIDIYPHNCVGHAPAITDALIVLKPSGGIEAWSGAALHTPPGQPEFPALAPPSGEIQSNYIGQFRAHGGEPPV